MAVRNGRAALRLTLKSFRAHTFEPVRFIAAENGSEDGAEKELAEHPWIEVVTLDERVADQPSSDRTDLIRHSVTLDTLAQQVRTPFFLTLDSDVEFLRAGWLTCLLDQALRDGVTAVGKFEVAIGAYRQRLAPHLLLIDTAAFRRLGLSFAGFVAIDDPEEAASFAGRHDSAYRLSPAEVTAFRTARFYAPGARLLEDLEAAGARWAEPDSVVRESYRHFGHMSWADGDPALADEHRRREAIIAARLRHYGSGPRSVSVSLP
jgi:hypothetical protein